MKYYFDTCIFLNIWQKEEDRKTGAPSWQYGEDLIRQITESNLDEGLFSYAVLGELSGLLGKQFAEKRSWLKSLAKFREVMVTETDFQNARSMWRRQHDVSLFDIMHLLLCKKESAIIVTRDKRLIDVAQQFVLVGPPEDFLTFG